MTYIYLSRIFSCLFYFWGADGGNYPSRPGRRDPRGASGPAGIQGPWQAETCSRTTIRLAPGTMAGGDLQQDIYIEKNKKIFFKKYLTRIISCAYNKTTQEIILANKEKTEAEKMKYHVYGYKRTEDGDKAVYKGTTEGLQGFLKAVQAAKEISARGAKCNVVYNGKTVVKM